MTLNKWINVALFLYFAVQIIKAVFRVIKQRKNQRDTVDWVPVDESLASGDISRADGTSTVLDPPMIARPNVVSTSEDPYPRFCEEDNEDNTDNTQALHWRDGIIVQTALGLPNRFGP